MELKLKGVRREDSDLQSKSDSHEQHHCDMQIQTSIN